MDIKFRWAQKNQLLVTLELNERLMIEIWIILAVVAALLLVWLNVLASIAVKYDHSLKPFARLAQYLIIWVVPFIGASTVLYFVYEHSPEAIPKHWIPWPFKAMIFGAPFSPNKNRDDKGSDNGGGYNSLHGNEGGGDGGGD